MKNGVKNYGKQIDLLYSEETYESWCDETATTLIKEMKVGDTLLITLEIDNVQIITDKVLRGLSERINNFNGKFAPKDNKGSITLTKTKQEDTTSEL